jgi:hypothetical protein
MPEIARPSTVLLQSCDERYAPLLEITGAVNAAYAAAHGYAYRRFVGFKSPGAGANFNRYYLIREELDRGEHDWALWLDADALVVDLSVPLESIIARTPDKLLIACQGTLRGDFDINNGVFLISLRHPLARTFVDHMLLSGDQLGNPPQGFYSDQRVMHEWLRDQGDQEGRIPIVQRYTGEESNLFNYDGGFIQHVLRERGDFETRLEILRGLAAAAVGADSSPQSNRSGSDASLGQLLNLSRAIS